MLNATTLLNKLYKITEEEFLEALNETQEACAKEYSKRNGQSSIPLKVGYEKKRRSLNK